MPSPYYTVQLDLEGCAFDLRINDAPLLENQRGLPVVVEIPINHLLRAGANQLALRLRPVPGQPALDDDTKCSLIVYTRESGAPRESRTEVARLQYPGAPTSREDDATLVAAPFQAAVPFPPFRWFTSPVIDGNDETRAQLIRELERFHSLLTAKNIDAILAAVRERDREHAGAYYEPLEEQIADTRREFTILFNEAEYQLRPARTRNPRLRIFANGRLARLDLTNGASPIYYMMAGEDTAAYVTLVFCKDALGKWIVIR